MKKSIIIDFFIAKCYDIFMEDYLKYFYKNKL
jgi:hypothetical protein